MTSEAHHLNSPPPAVSVKARAKEIEARTQAAGRDFSLASGPPVASQEVIGKRYQVSNNPESPGGPQSPYPSRRCSEGDISHSKVRQVPPPPAPKERRVSLEHVPLPVVPERRSTLGRLIEKSEGSSSGARLCQRESTSKFAPFTGGGKSGVTCHERATSDFSPAIFSTSRLLPASSAPPKQSPLDDIITALEKICDEFELPESVIYSTADQPFQRGSDDVFEKRIHTPPGDHYVRRDVNDKTQWLTEHGIPQVDRCQQIRKDSKRKSFESILTASSLQDDNQHSTSEESPVVYRSSVQFSPKRQVVSATLEVSPPKIPSKHNRECRTSAPAIDSEADRPNIEKSLRLNNTTVVLERSDGKYTTATDLQLFPEPIPTRKSWIKNDSALKNSDIQDRYVTSSINSEKHFLGSVKSGCNSTKKSPNESSESSAVSVKSQSIYTIKPAAVATKPAIPKILTFPPSPSVQLNVTKKSDVSSPSEELEIVKNILANLDFEKYKRRYSLDDMEEKSPKSARAQKSSSVKLKDLFDLLKPNSDNSSGSNKKPLGLCRSSSFSNAETDKSPLPFFLQNEENDHVSPLPEVSTLPRRKSPSRETFMKANEPLIPLVGEDCRI